VPGRVIEAVAAAMAKAASNLGGAFSASRHAVEIWDEAHGAMADFLGAGSGREIVIGPSMTSLTFQMSRAIGRTFEPGDEIIVTRMDHEGNVSPWLHLARDRGLAVKWLDFDRDTWRDRAGRLARPAERAHQARCTHLCEQSHRVHQRREASGGLARQAGALVYVDAVQFAPHGLVDVATLGADFLVCSSYKFFGPHLGILWGREDLLQSLEPTACAAGRKTCPAGTRPERRRPNCSQASPPRWTISPGSASRSGPAPAGARRGGGLWRMPRPRGGAEPATDRRPQGHGRDHSRHHQLQSHRRAGADRIGDPSPPHAASPGAGLADSGICVWSGHNYAYEVVKSLGLDERQGVLRIGLAHYNTPGEVDRALTVLRRLLN
jgi:selenocysteine lyase/cysteine desulfurase